MNKPEQAISQMPGTAGAYNHCQSDRDEDQITESGMVLWARRFHDKSMESVCIFQPESQYVLYANPALLSEAGLATHGNELTLNTLFTDDTISTLTNASASNGNGHHITVHGRLKGGSGSLYEMKLERNFAGTGAHLLHCRKLAQQGFTINEHNLLAAVLSLPKEAICVVDRHGKYTLVNQSFADLLGYEIHEFVGKDYTDDVDPEDRESTIDFFNNHIGTAFEVIDFEVRFVTKAGVSKWLLWSANYMEGENFVIGLARDITDSRLVREELQVKSEQLEIVIASLDDAVFEYDVEGNFTRLWCNNNQILQLMPEGYIRKSLQEAYQVLPELTGPFIVDFENAIANNQICYRDFSFEVNGEVRWLNSKITPMLYPDGRPRGFSQRITDISEKKKIELAIAEKNRELRAAHRELKEIIENTSEIIFKLDGNDNIIFVSPEFKRSLGFPVEEIVGSHISDLVHIDDRARFVADLDTARDSSLPASDRLYRTANKTGAERWLNITPKFLRNSKNEAFSAIIFAREVSELKQTLDSLTISETRYRSLVNSLNEGIIMYDRTGQVIASNNAAETIFRLEERKDFSDYVGSEKRRVIREDYSEFPMHEFPVLITANTGQSVKDVIMGVEILPNALTWVNVNSEPIYYSNNSPIPDAVVVSIKDITLEKESREQLAKSSNQLRESSERLTGILDSITDGFIALNAKLEITHWNKVVEDYTGIAKSDALGKKISELRSYLSAPTALQHYAKAMENQVTINFEQYLRVQNNWFETSAYPFRDGLFIYCRDISLRKQQQLMLALEKRVLEYNASPAATLRTTVDYFLQGLEEVFPGMQCSVLTLNVADQTMRNLSAPSLAKAFVNAIEGERIGPDVGSCGTAMFNKDPVIVSDISTDPLWSKYRHVAAEHNIHACWSFPIKDAQQEVLATIATYYHHPCSPTSLQLELLDRVKDLLKVIIENKLADQKLRISNERYLLATRASNDAIWDFDLISNSLYFGEGFTTIFGYKANTSPLPLDSWGIKVHPDDREWVTKSFAFFIESATHKTWEGEYRYLHADGRYVIVNDRAFLIFNQEGKVARIVGSLQDVTEKRKLEKELLKQELDRQKSVAQAVVDAQEKERAEIGKELHDNVNQILSTAKLYLELARNDDKERLNLINRSAANIYDAINEIRAISRSLVPPSIGDLGIVESIRDLMESVKATRKLHAEFYYSDGIEASINEKQQLMLFRIIQEQVNNVLKHSEATNLIIELMVEGSIVDLTISDNGKGFDKTNKLKRGVGLTNIASRTELFNGTVNLITAPGKGCTLNIHIPIINE